jgi:MYXO-CTERM domain-containing protein
MMKPLLLCLLPAALCPAATVTIPADKDTTLYESATGALANGAGELFFAGRTNQQSEAIRRGVIEFDIQSFVPSGAVINSATLTLYASRAGLNDSTISLHRLTRAWKEGLTDAPGGEGSGAPVIGNDATWLYSSTPGIAWSGPGAAGDFIGAASSSSLITAAGAFYSWNGMTADVQAWLADDTANHGWILTGNETTASTAVAFASRNNANSGFHPLLTLDYTVVPEPGAAALAALGMLTLLRRRVTASRL